MCVRLLIARDCHVGVFAWPILPSHKNRASGERIGDFAPVVFVLERAPQFARDGHRIIGRTDHGTGERLPYFVPPSSLFVSAVGKPDAIRAGPAWAFRGEGAIIVRDIPMRFRRQAPIARDTAVVTGR